MTRRFFLWPLLSSLLASCAWQNPMAPIRADIAQFRSQRPSPFKTYRVGERRMRLAESGDEQKRPVLFVHGSPGSWEAWAQFLRHPELRKNFHLLAVDRPGFGGSGPGQSEVSLQLQAQAVVAALEFNRSGLPAVLVGHSFGGAVVGQIAVGHPERVAAIVFVASSLDPALEEVKWYQHVATWWPFRALLPTDLRVCNEEIYGLRSELAHLERRLGDSRAPVFIIHGDSDPLVPVGNVRFLQRSFGPGVVKHTTILTGMDHYIPWKDPASIIDAISRASEL